MKDENLNISERKKEVLILSVKEFIATGEPISSGRLTELGLKASSATIRNELASLEELGFLRQLHTSGGRVPTEKGYNAYVTSLAGRIPADSKKLKKIENKFLANTKYLSQMIDGVAKTISNLTNFPGAVILDGFENFVVKNIKIVPLLSNQCLILIETNFGVIDPVFIDVKKVDEKLCYDASVCFTSNFKGKTIKEVVAQAKETGKMISSDIKNFQEIFVKVVELLNNVIETYKDKVVSSGTNNLLELKEFKESEKAKALIDFIEDDKGLKDVLTNDESEEKLSFKIGQTDKTTQAGGYGLVKTKCVIDGINIGSLAVVGPQRMDYLKIASALSYIANEFEEFNKGEGN